RRCRVVVIGHGLARAPIGEIFGLHRPLTYLCLAGEQWRLRRVLRRVDVMSEQTTAALADLRRVYGGRLECITMGCDFGFWAADVYVSVATDEAGPVSVMKAMACGLPVLTTPVGATWELMTAHGAGVVVPARDHAAWARALSRILDEGGPPALEIVAARRAFDWAVIGERVVALYAELLP